MEITKATGQPAEELEHLPTWHWTFLALFALLVAGLYGALLIAITYGRPDLLPKRLSLDKELIFGLVSIMLFGPCFAGLTHELGHALAGWFVGFRFQFLVFGPVRLERTESGGAQLRFNWDPALIGGVSLSLPADGRNLRTRFAWVAVGGAATSLTLAALALLVFAFAPGWDGFLYRFAVGWLGLCCAVIALGTAIPTRVGPIMISDGARLLRLVRGGTLAARDLALLHLMGLAAANTPPREWEYSVVATALAPCDGSAYECQARYLAYLLAVDRGEGGQAYEHLSRALELSNAFPKSSAHLLDVEAAYFEGWWRGRVHEARRALGRLPPKSPSLPRFERLRAEAAVEAAAGETASAHARVEEALRLAPTTGVWTRDRLTGMKRRLESSV